MKQYVKLIRVHHYIKNVLIFFPLFFSADLLNFSLLKNCLLGFAGFSFLSSAIYIFNDLRDIESDRLHTEKRRRPLASGAISKKSAFFAAAVLVALAAATQFFITAQRLYCVIVLLIYLLVNIIYSMGGKHIPIIDVFLLVGGFFLRLYYGSALTDIPISGWMYLTIVSLSFYLVLGKRRNELLRQEDETRKVLAQYNYSFLDKMMYMFLGMTLVFYSMWLVGGGNRFLYLTIPLVMIICMQYSLLVESSSSGDPVDVLLSSKLLLLFAVILGLIFFAGLYLAPKFGWLAIL
ncbi:MAG TPA: prenyltransferase [Ruminococcaceae bacterium]|nr:prenyltransferase [Oscillospiraceae bacterium]